MLYTVVEIQIGRDDGMGNQTANLLTLGEKVRHPNHSAIEDSHHQLATFIKSMGEKS